MTKPLLLALLPFIMACTAALPPEPAVVLVESKESRCSVNTCWPKLPLPEGCDSK